MRPFRLPRPWLAAALAITALLAACGPDDADPPLTDAETQETDAAEASTQPTEEPTPEEAAGAATDPAPSELPIPQLRIRHPESLAFGAPFAVLADRGAPQLTDELDVDVWTSPDVLRSLLINQEAELTAVPSYVAANLHNRDVDVQLAAIMVWGLLWVLGPDDIPATWDELEGATVVVPFPNDMPDLVFRRLLDHNGLVPGTDLEIRSVAQPAEAVAQLVSGQADWAVLPEHAASLALARATESGRELDRVIDLQQAWGDAFDTPARIPQAGIVVPTSLAEQPALVTALLDEVADTVDVVNAQDPATIDLLADRFDLPPGLVADVIPRLNLEVVPAAAAQEELEAFFTELAALSPEIIGGQLPDDGLYLDVSP